MEQNSSCDVADRRACHDTTVRFFRLLDASDVEGCVATFAAEGTWVRGGKPLKGHSAITAALAARPSDRRTCHILSNLEVSLLGPSEAQVDFCLTAYEGTPFEPGGRVVGKPAGGIRRCVDRLVREGDAWLIQHKSSQAVFDVMWGAE